MIAEADTDQDTQSSDAGELLGETTEIYRALRSLQLSRSLVTLRIANSPQVYSSMILLCDLDNQQFIIDAVRPESGNTLIQQGASFTLSGFYEGIQVLCKDNRISPQKKQTELENAFSIDFPNFVYRKQRRQAFRTNIPQFLTREIQLGSSQRQKPLTGVITDLSSTGIGCELGGLVQPELKSGEVFENSAINIDSNLVLNCSLIVRHPHPLPRAGITLCGLAFDKLTAPEQKK